MFEILRNLLKDQATLKKEETSFFIRNGYCNEWADEHKVPSDDGIKRYSTDLRWTQYQDGTINRETAIAYAVKRADRQADKALAKKLDQVTTASKAPNVTGVSISVEWTHNRTWGNNPTATVNVFTTDGVTTYTGSASGYGYDKESAAVAGALDKSPAILKMLYQAKENTLKRSDFKWPISILQWNDSNRGYIHYGAGYGVLPYFEGGVGMTSLRGVFEACGYKADEETHGRMYDYYHYSVK